MSDAEGLCPLPEEQCLEFILTLTVSPLLYTQGHRLLLCYKYPSISELIIHCVAINNLLSCNNLNIDRVGDGWWTCFIYLHTIIKWIFKCSVCLLAIILFTNMDWDLLI